MYNFFVCDFMNSVHFGMQPSTTVNLSPANQFQFPNSCHYPYVFSTCFIKEEVCWFLLLWGLWWADDWTLDYLHLYPGECDFATLHSKRALTGDTPSVENEPRRVLRVVQLDSIWQLDLTSRELLSTLMKSRCECRISRCLVAGIED